MQSRAIPTFIAPNPCTKEWAGVCPMLIRRILLAFAVTLFATSAFALDVTNLLSAVAMPLAVAAASDLPGVQQSDLIDLVSQLNAADVPPAEFVQIVRYIPVALID